MEQKRFSLHIKNNTTSRIDVAMLGNPSFPGFFNALRQFSWLITSETYATNQISIEVKKNGQSSFVTYTGTLPSLDPAGVVAALNSLNVGTFYLDDSGGNIYMLTRNDEFVYGNLTIGTSSPPASTFSFVINSASAVARIFALIGIAPLTGTVDWGDGTVQSFNAIGNHSYAIPGIYTVNIIVDVPANVTRINNDSDNITSVSGLNNMPALNYLQININNLSALDVSGNPAMATVVAFSNSLTAFDISSNPNIITLNLFGSQLPVSDINNILINLDSFGLLNGFVRLDGQTPAAPPSGAGAVAKTSLQGKGWTVITD